MSNFLYKTRNRTNPAKLPKVWICAHHKDIPAFLQNDANKILSLNPNQEIVVQKGKKSFVKVLIK